MAFLEAAGEFSMGCDLSQDGMSRGAEGPEQSRPRKVQPCGTPQPRALLTFFISPCGPE